jgi:hypothetical protein
MLACSKEGETSFASQLRCCLRRVRWWEIPPLARPERQTHMYEVKSEKVTKVTIVVRQDYTVAMEPRLCPDKCLHYRRLETGTSANIIVCLDNG